jgi:N-acetylglucosaminyldiphosphoundecaprenol N-acetyl-beta-D-mannosaminyltransferase
VPVKNKQSDEQRELLQTFLKKLSAKNQPRSASILYLRPAIFRTVHGLIQICFVIPLLPFTLVIHLCLIIRKIFSKIPIFITKDCYGKQGKVIEVNYFNLKSGSRFALVYLVLSRKLDFTGYSLNKERQIGDAFIYDYNPGIIDLWYIRSASRTAYEGIKETDKEFIISTRLKAEVRPNIFSLITLLKEEVLLIIRYEIARIFNSFRAVKNLPHLVDPIFIFKIRLRNISMLQTLEEIKLTIKEHTLTQAQNVRRKIYFVNPDCLNKTFTSSAMDYREILENPGTQNWIFADGIGINIAIDLMGYPKNENVNGTDLMPRIAELAAGEGFSFFLLGARPGVAEKTKIKLQSLFPTLHIKGTHHGYFDHVKDSPRIVKLINELKVDILFVAFGVPYQERWIEKWFPHLNCPVVIGVGGLFDFYSGRIKRAPRWLRDIGLEWVFRLMMEPRRMFKRYVIGNPVFLIRVFKLRNAARLINNQILKAKKKNLMQIMKPSRQKKMEKYHGRLLDIFPLVANFCAQKKISILIMYKDKMSARSTCEKLNLIFPDTVFMCQADNGITGYKLVITNYSENELLSIVDTQRTPAFYFIDQSFADHYDNLNIIWDTH